MPSIQFQFNFKAMFRFKRINNAFDLVLLALHICLGFSNESIIRCQTPSGMALFYFFILYIYKYIYFNFQKWGSRPTATVSKKTLSLLEHSPVHLVHSSVHLVHSLVHSFYYLNQYCGMNSPFKGMTRQE